MEIYSIQLVGESPLPFIGKFIKKLYHMALVIA
jgi:hypothetical protein